MNNQYKENIISFSVTGIRESIWAIALGFILGAIMFYGATS